jgi:hypothetical protein
MINKKFLITKLLNYPDISYKDYKLLQQQKNKLLDNKSFDNNELFNIDNKINLYNEKEMIIQMIKQTK